MAGRPLPPIMIGITGKRDLRRKDAAVAETLKACFDLLDQHLPASSKTLLTGLAAGADTVAARLALDRGWKVVAVLPFALEVYLQDFDPAQAEELLKLVDPEKGVLRDPTRGRVIVLDPLREPDSDVPISIAALARAGDQSTHTRADHYEQVGLFIADACALLIGVMPASEKPARVGGTARIVEYRLQGAFDEISERIIAHSQVLPPPVPVDAPQFRPLWLVDLEAVGAAAQPLNAVQIWRRRPRGTATHGDDATIEIERIRCGRPEDLMKPLRLAARIEAFNVLAVAVDDTCRTATIATRARGDEQLRRDLEDRALPDNGDASALIKQVRSDLSVIQGWAKRSLKATVWLLAALFVSAVLALEIIHLEVRTLDWRIAGIRFDWSMPYVVVSIAILGVLFYARVKKLPQYTEDYRAVAEALRVQLVWWSAGLRSREYRVDRMYLCGTVGSLGMVRAAIRYLVSAALVERPLPPAAPADVMEWISGQVRFFESRTKKRQAQLSRVEHSVWFLFIGSIGIGTWLLFFQQRHLIVDIDAALNWPPGVMAGATPWGTLLLAVALFALSRSISRTRKRGVYGWRRFGTDLLDFLSALLAGIAIAGFINGLLLPPYGGAAFLGTTVMDVGGCIKDGLQTVPPEAQAACANAVSYRLLATLTALVAAFAGARRFYSERMAQEAELHAYQESLATFSRAYAELRRLGPHVGGEDRQRFETIVIELGKIALKENESWIRAHRVRPLEPHL